jgi:hypothetical protein
MFAVVEAYQSLTDVDDESSNCLTHVETRAAAERVVKEQKQISFDLAVETYAYFVVEFKGECPNCGRNFEF